LSLHADGVHLLGNCLIGGFMAHLLCKTIGYGLGWLLLLLTGALGNLINITIRSTTHHSVGFSTAVFAAIGMFSGLQLKGGKSSPLQIIIPLGAGAGLLAFLGTEGRQTDLGAHLFGFCCGIAAGLLTRLSGLIKAADNNAMQRIFFVVALALISLCWWLAVVNSPVSLL
jgi:membrane associated rhomboid family serine protease